MSSNAVEIYLTTDFIEEDETTVGQEESEREGEIVAGLQTLAECVSRDVFSVSWAVYGGH